MKHSVRRAYAVIIALAALVPVPAETQSSGFLNAVGYGFTGAATGLAATADAPCTGQGFICIPSVTVAATLGGGVLGLVTGSVISSKANEAVAKGRSLGRGHLAAVSYGMVVGAGALGLVVGGLLVNPQEEGTVFGSDEQTLTLFALAGAAFGVTRLRRSWGRFTGPSVELQPFAMVHGRPGIITRVRY